MKKNYLLLIMALLSAKIFAQTTTMTFTGRDSYEEYVQLDSIVIRNLTRGWQETLVWPDTTLTMQVGTGIDNLVGKNDCTAIRLSQNNPNPFKGTTSVEMSVANPGSAIVEITDIAGRVVGKKHLSSLQPGIHQLRITISPPGLYFLTARMNGQSSLIKIINEGDGGSDIVEYQGIVEKTKNASSMKSAPKSNSSNPFQLGDEMEYIGYTTAYNRVFESEHIIQQQNETQTVGLKFTFSLVGNDAQPCPEMPTVTDIDGNVYNTVRIGDQCWMKENLRATHYYDGSPIPLGSAQSNTDPYYYDNTSSSIALQLRGYLYNWAAVMHGSSSSNAYPSGVQGICPAGWHLPSDAEWIALENYLSAHAEYRCSGITSNIARSLATPWGWNSSTSVCAIGYYLESNNATRFSAVPVGSYYGYLSTGEGAAFWSSSERVDYNSYAWYHYISYDNRGVMRQANSKYRMNSVRCLRVLNGLDTIVNTGLATNITATTATLNGTVSNNGSFNITGQGFEWKYTNGGSYTPISVTDNSMTHNLLGLMPNTSYTYRAFATMATGTTYGNEVTFSTDPIPCSVSNTHPAQLSSTYHSNGYNGANHGLETVNSDGQIISVTDYDGNEYSVVQIGSQCWLAENMRCTHSPSTGTFIVNNQYESGSQTQTSYTYTGKMARWYHNTSTTYEPKHYGLLYNWNAAVDIFNSTYGELSINTDNNNAVDITFSDNRQGICPIGWHMPSDSEWVALTETVGVSESNIVEESGEGAGKLTAGNDWFSSQYSSAPGNYNYTERNTSGFSAVPAGCFRASFQYQGDYAFFWTASQTSSARAYDRSLSFCYNGIGHSSYDKSTGFSVRCLRD